MALAAQERGYEYLAITDHSHYLRDGRLERQAEEIDALNERLAPFRILRGVEVNIRADGELDVDDETLARLDWVVASLHSRFDTSPTERVLAAMENPHVDCIGHLTGAQDRRAAPPADVDVGRVIVERRSRRARSSRSTRSPTGSTSRDVARAARRARPGLRLTVSSDAHRVAALAYVEIGVGQARRAWLTSEQVLNTRPWPQIASAC